MYRSRPNSNRSATVLPGGQHLAILAGRRQPPNSSASSRLFDPEEGPETQISRTSSFATPVGDFPRWRFSPLAIFPFVSVIGAIRGACHRCLRRYVPGRSMERHRTSPSKGDWQRSDDWAVAWEDRQRYRPRCNLCRPACKLLAVDQINSHESVVESLNCIFSTYGKLPLR